MVGEVTSQPFPLSLSVISSDSACQQVRASGAAFSWVLVRGAGRLKLIDTERHETDMLTSGICCSNLVSGRTGWSKNVCNLSPYENKFPASESTSPELSIFFLQKAGTWRLVGRHRPITIRWFTDSEPEQKCLRRKWTRKESFGNVSYQNYRIGICIFNVFCLLVRFQKCLYILRQLNTKKNLNHLDTIQCQFDTNMTTTSYTGKQKEKSRLK